MGKAYAAAAPEIVGAVDVFGDEADLGLAADQAVFVGAGFGSDEGEQGCAVRRGDGDPTAIAGIGDVRDDAEPELLDVEPEALILVADVDGGVEDTKVRALGALAVFGFNDARGGGRLDGF